MTQPPDYLRRIWDDAAAKLDATLLPDGMTAEYDRTPLTVRKIAHLMDVPEGLLMDEGVIPDTRPPVHISWRSRMSWRFSAWRERVRRRVGGWIAGVDLSDRDD